VVGILRVGSLAAHNDVRRRFAHLAVVTLVHVAVAESILVQRHAVLNTAEGHLSGALAPLCRNLVVKRSFHARVAAGVDSATGSVHSGIEEVLLATGGLVSVKHAAEGAGAVHRAVSCLCEELGLLEMVGLGFASVTHFVCLSAI
jgi:hypothetical protein